jgi:CheY-like chemotaxis protein
MMNKKHLNILLADDDTDDCIFFKEALDELLIKTDLTTVHDGEQLMIYLDGTSRKLIDVLFLDINMPRKNGFECLAEIKQNENLKELPVIIFSTSYEQEVVNSLYESGAHYFIRKPSEFAQFKKIIYHTLLLIIQEEIAQPSRANFVLTAANNLMD